MIPAFAVMGQQQLGLQQMCDQIRNLVLLEARCSGNEVKAHGTRKC
jgi:hypothetical protein